MPIIFYGSRGIKSELERGTFYCPKCDAEQYYRLMQIRPYFTLYFLPLFPIGGAERYVECERCSQGYKEAVLQMEAPGEGDRAMRAVYQELSEGSSLETVRGKLAAAGMDGKLVEGIMEQLSEGKAWECNRCGEHYLDSVKRCGRCAS